MPPWFGNPTHRSIATGLLLAAGVAVAWTFIVPAEDAVILYEYSRNLASRGVITFGGAGVPIEGATDFLIMATLALLDVFGVDAHLGSLVLTACGVGLLSREIARTSGAMTAAVAVLATPFLQAAMAGFTALIFSAVFVLCLKYFLERSVRAFYVAALVLCLIRPDGVVWAAGACALAIWRAMREHRTAEFREALIWLVLPGAAYFVARAAYFGEWFPLPFIVKAAGTRDAGLFFSGSFGAVGEVAVPAVCAAVASVVMTRRLDATRLVAMVVVIPTVFLLTMQLEQNIGNRFLAPMFFGTVFLLGLEHRRLAQVFVLLVVVASARTTLVALHTTVDSRHETVSGLATALRGIPGKLLTSEAGRLPYYSQWRAHDSWGLNTPAYTRQLITAADLRREQYDLIVANCVIKMLSEPGRRLGVRSWNDMCATVTDHMRNAPHDVFLVPVYRAARTRAQLEGALGRPAGGCRMVHIYAVSSTSAFQNEIKAVLVDHGAILYSRLTRDDAVCGTPASTPGQRAPGS